MTSRQTDLVVLVADVQQEKTLETLLTHRQESLGIRQITFEIYRHPRKDAGVYHEADDFLAPYISSHDFALVVLDSAWDGVPVGGTDHLQFELLQRMAIKGWAEDRCQIIVIVPELEAWVWAISDMVPKVLRTTWEDIRTLANQMHCWDESHLKPDRPKELLESLLRQQKRPRSSALFQELAQKVSLNRCEDPAFVLLRETLQRWFGDPPSWSR